MMSHVPWPSLWRTEALGPLPAASGSGFTTTWDPALPQPRQPVRWDCHFFPTKTLKANVNDFLKILLSQETTSQKNNA